MKISTKARYALVALVDLGELEGGHSSLQDISKRQSISLAYLEQIFVRLRRKGIVNSIRGPKGGYCLAHCVDDIRVVDVLLAVRETIDALHIGAGSVGAQSGSKAQSLSNRLWESMSANVYVFLHGITLGDIIKNDIKPCRAVPMLFNLEYEGGNSVTPQS